MPAAIERTIVCAVESVRGTLTAMCGVEVDAGELQAEPEIITCPLCIAEAERRWAQEDES